MKIVLATLAFSLAAPSAFAGFYCTAKPNFYSTRVPLLPGWGRGATKAEASAEAERSCRSRNAMGQASCRTYTCSKE